MDLERFLQSNLFTCTYIPLQLKWTASNIMVTPDSRQLTLGPMLGIILKSGYSYPELAEGQALRSPATIT